MPVRENGNHRHQDLRFLRFGKGCGYSCVQLNTEYSAYALHRVLCSDTLTLLLIASHCMQHFEHAT